MLREQLAEAELQDLVVKFRNYKDQGATGDFFGRDTFYDRPPSAVAAGLWHVHTADANLGHLSCAMHSSVALVILHLFIALAISSLIMFY